MAEENTIFHLSLPELNDTADQYVDEVNQFGESVLKCHNAVMTLSELGWSGVAQAAFYEKFFLWMQRAEKLESKLTYTGQCLDISSAMSEILKGECEPLPSVLALDSTSSPEGEGIIYLDNNQKDTVKNNLWFLYEEQLPPITKNLGEAQTAAQGLRYRAFSLGTESLRTELDTKKANFKAFDEAFTSYCENVHEFEQINDTQLALINDPDFSAERGESMLSWRDAADTASGLAADGVNAGIQGNRYLPGKFYENGRYTIVKDVDMSKWINKDTSKSLGTRWLTSNLDAGKYPLVSAARAKIERINKVSRITKGIGVAFGVVSATISGINEYNRNPYMPTERKVINTATTVAVDAGITVGSAVLGSVAAGAVVGSALGTVFPVVGNIAGAVVGAAVGLVVGIGLNFLAGHKFFDGGTKSVKDKIADGVDSAVTGVKNAWNWLTGKKAQGTVPA